MVPTCLDCWRDYNTQVYGAHQFGLLAVYITQVSGAHLFGLLAVLNISRVFGANLFRLLAGQLLQSGRFDRLLTLTTIG